MSRIRAAATLLAFTAGLVSIALGAEPLDRFSTEADVVIRLKAPQATTARVAELADAVQSGAGDMVRQRTPGLGQVISVPALAGVDLSRDWYVVLFAQGQRRPHVCFAIPATDAEQLTSALPRRMTSQVEGDWVLYTDSDAGIPAAAAAGSGISSVLAGESAAVFDRGDLSLFVNVEHLTDVYRDEIASAQDEVDEVLEMIGEATAEINGINMQPIMDMYQVMIEGGFQALDDASTCSAAVTVGADGLSVEELVTFADGSSTSQVLAAQPTSALQSLAKLPAEAAGYFGISGDMQRLMEWSWSMNMSLLADEPEQQQKIESAMQAWKQINFGDMAGSFSLGVAEEGLFRYAAIYEANPVDKFRQSMRQMSELMGTVEVYGMKQEATVEPDAETIGARKIDRVTVKQEYPPELDPTGMQAKMLEILFGPRGMITRIAYVENAAVMAMGGGRGAMEAVLQAYDQPANPGFARHRHGLIDEPNVLVLVDLPSLAVSGLTAAADTPGVPIPINAAALAQLEIVPSYLGFTLAAEPNALRARTFVPVEQFRGIAALAQLFSGR